MSKKQDEALKRQLAIPLKPDFHAKPFLAIAFTDRGKEIVKYIEVFDKKDVLAEREHYEETIRKEINLHIEAEKDAAKEYKRAEAAEAKAKEYLDAWNEKEKAWKQMETWKNEYRAKQLTEEARVKELESASKRAITALEAGAGGPEPCGDVPLWDAVHILKKALAGEKTE